MAPLTTCNLQGRLSLVEIGDVVVLTSEGSDQGYVIDAPNSRGEALGVNAPVLGSLGSNFADTLNSNNANIFLLQGSGTNVQNWYTYYKVVWICEGLTGEFESPVSNAVAVKLHDNVGTPNQYHVTAQTTVAPFATGFPMDRRIKGLKLFRSTTTKDVDDDDSGLNYVKVAESRYPSNAGNFPHLLPDRMFEGELDVSEPLRDNSRMPEDVVQMALFNDRIFGANNNELRYSDVRNAVPVWSAWPVINLIRTGSRIDFCAAYRGMLLFGGADGLYRLSGTSPANFRYDQISSRGPVSPHAWGVLDNAFGFVGSDGLYLTDGTAAPEIAPQLKGYFNRYEVEGGLVGRLPNKASLWGVHRRNKSTSEVDIIYFVNEGNDWIRVEEGSSDRIGSTERIAKAIVDPGAIEISDGTHIRQYTSVKFDGLPITGVIADQQRAPRLIDWVVDDASVDGITHYTGGTPVEEDIAWSWESQQLDWNAQGLGEQMKIFTELDISGIAENDATITFYIDDRAPVTKTVRLDRDAHDRFHPVRVRINRRGFGCRFKLEGTGAVTLRGLQMKGWV